MAKMFKFIIILIVIALAVGVLAYVVYSKILKPKVQPTINPVGTTTKAESIPATPTPPVVIPPFVSTSTPTTTPVVPSAVFDCVTLTPTDIASYQVKDSDFDSLSDYDELCVYKTNNSSPDTDGDGYFDGVEVKGGFNPNGSGKLIK